MKNGNVIMIVAVVLVFCIGVVAAAVLETKDRTSSNKPSSEVEVGPKWQVSGDMVPDARGTSIHIISDPHDQKFLLVVTGRGTSVIPYVEK